MRDMLLILSLLALWKCQAMPSTIEDNCSYYISECEAEPQCAAHLTDASKCDTEPADTYWECFGQNIDRSLLTDTTEFMEACFYEESKDLMTYSYYKDTVPSRGMYGLNWTVFDFPDATGLQVGVEYTVTIHLDWADSVQAVPKPNEDGCNESECISENNEEGGGGGILYANEVWHINLHACLLTDTQTTCSIKYPERATVSTYNEQGYIAQGTKYDVLPTPLTLDHVGTYKLLGHIRYYSNSTGERVKWDIGMTKLITVEEATTTTREVESGNASFLTIFTTICLFFLVV